MSKNKVVFLDNLRSFIIILVVVFHASLIYMFDAPEWWYVIDNGKSKALSLIVLFLNIFMMPVIFFISGYFADASYRTKSVAQFITSKFSRLIVPWLAGVALIAPVQVYLHNASRNIPTASLSDLLFFKGSFHQGHMWYLSLLFVFFMCYALIRAAKFNPRNVIVEKWFPPAFILVNSIFYFVTSLFYNSEAWTGFGPLSFQPVKILIYFNYFMLGSAFEKAGQNGFDNLAAFKNSGSKAIAIFISGVIYLFSKLGPAAKLNSLIESLAFNVFCLLILELLLSVFKKYFNESGRAGASLSSNSFGIYLLHQPNLLFLAYVMLKFDVNAYAKWLCAIAAGLFLAYAQSVFFRMLSRKAHF
ncbi:MAG TPA: acyltransferase family protein [Candidatus Wallbacteria bacterium]|nr:acyltransferase family protein [Candidatus Wallbacteria bacterium]